VISQPDFQKVSGYLLQKTGIIITAEHAGSVKRFIEKKTQGSGIKNYLESLEKNEMEFHELIKNATIHETYFFREEKYFHLLDSFILPAIKNAGHAPYIWSAAAATGEEALSLAVVLCRHWNMETLRSRPLLATDIDIFSLRRLEEGFYSAGSFRTDGSFFHNVLLQKGTKNEKGFTVNADFLRLIQFKKLNLVQDDYLSILPQQPDIVFLCNILVYFDGAVRDRVIDRIAAVIRPGGYLFVSSVNTAFISHPALTLQETGKCFYFKKQAQKSV